jgi:hypothetical protein
LLLGLDWKVEICHAYRYSEANQYTNALTNMSCDIDHTMMFYESYLTQVSNLAQTLRIATPRWISL